MKSTYVIKDAMDDSLGDENQQDLTWGVLCLIHRWIIMLKIYLNILHNLGNIQINTKYRMWL